LATVLAARVDRVAHQRASAEVLERLRAFVHRETEHFRGTALEHSDDGLVVAFDGPARAIRCAVALVLTARRLGVPLRAGVDIGQCVLRSGRVVGDAVTRARALATVADADGVLVSRAVHDLVAGAGLRFDAVDETAAEGLSGGYRVDAGSVLTPGRLPS
jgi:class 3 adenylate cyclase